MGKLTRSRIERPLLVLLATSILSTHALSAHVVLAQDKPAPAKDARAEAQERYRRALELFNDGSYDASLLELRRAYELAPSYRILYNIALVNVQLNDYASALGFFERYLAEGGNEIPEARVEEVRKEIARLQTRVAAVSIATDIDGVEVSVDDLVVGKTPLEKPIRVNAGRRRVSVFSPGKIPQSRVVEMAGGDKIELKFQLKEPERPAPQAPVVTAPPPPPPPKPAPQRRVPWIAWGITGALAAGAATTGVLALLARSDQKDAQKKWRVEREELDFYDTKVENLALATDILLGATVVAGGISMYLTLRSPSDESDEQSAGETAIVIQPNGILGRVTF